ncbi:hypothetical protein V1264_007238 [Littorina saxatilis]|uniref:Uncharacterized protein n=2 Tax=Littorina saxatilis TaxID=31220 RepID=A0AAN9G3J5_9CAEN
MAEADHEMTESDCETSVNDYETAESENGTAESDYETAESDYETAESDYETAESDYETAESDYETAESDSCGSGYDTATDADSEDSRTEPDDRQVKEEVRNARWHNVGAYFQKANKDMATVSFKAAETGAREKPEDQREMVEYSMYITGLNNQMNGFWSSAVSMDRHIFIQHPQPCRISRSVRLWAVQEAGKNADIVETLYIARFCSEEEGDLIIREVVARENWRLVSLLVAHQLVSKSSRQWGVEEAARVADTRQFTVFILPCCTRDLNHDFVLTRLIERGAYELASELIEKKRQCSKECLTWALKETCTKAEKKDLAPLLRTELIQGLELDSVMMTVANKGFWGILSLMLRADCVVNCTTRLQAVLIASEHASSEDAARILRNCFPEELDCVLVQLVKWSKWHLVDKALLERDYVMELSRGHEWLQLNNKLYTDDSLWCSLLQQFDNDTLFSLFEEALKQDSRFKELMYFLFSREWFYTHKHKIVSTIAPHETAYQTCNRLWASNKTFSLAFGEMSVVLEEVFTTLDTVSSDRQSQEWDSFVDCLKRWTAVALDSHARVKVECNREGECTETKLLRDWEHLLIQLVLEKVAPNWRSMEFRTFEELLAVFALVPLVPTLQNVSLKYMVKWSSTKIYLDLVGHTCWYHVPEEVRRFVLCNAVKGKRWEAVSQLADHSLYDDERGWALGQAMYSGQWRVFLMLAQQGLNKDQRRRVYRQVAKHGDWDTVHEMLERGADVRTVHAELFTANISRDPHPPEDVVTRYKDRLTQLRDLGKKLAREAKDFDGAVSSKNWSAVLYKIRRRGTEGEVWQAMMAALEARAWHVLTQLVRGRNSPALRKQLFPLVMEQQQWSVVRVLLERGVSVELRLSAIPIFLEHHQWLLAARVTEHDVTDSVIRHVMRQALEHREGSLAAHCIGSLKEPLSVIERQTIFQQALSKGLWWAVKRLVEERDPEGKTERDVALQAAAERHQWSVVTHCLQHGADIDKKDEEGNTLLHRWARRGDWTGVVKLVEQGADQNIPDSEGYILLHRVVRKRETVTDLFRSPVKLLIEFHGDINRPDPEGSTAWEYLVAQNNTKIIDTALMWSQVDTKKVDKFGNTALHKLCAVGMADTVRSLVARGNSPLTVNYDGMTALCSATNCYDHEIVLECVKLGVGTFQSRFTDASRKMKSGIVEPTPCFVQQYEVASPFQTAAAEGDLPLMEALYQAGACSNAELHRFSAALKARYLPSWSGTLMKAKELCEYVETLARNPRSLMSACRLTICHQLGVRRDRERIVRQLDRLDDRERHQQVDTHMVNYLLFSDLEQSFPYPSVHQPDEPESDEVKIDKVLSILATGKLRIGGNLLHYYLQRFMPDK